MSDSHGYHQMIDRVKELEPDGDFIFIVETVKLKHI